MKENNLNIIYPSLAALCALVGTGALLARGNNEGTLLIWGILLLAANVLWAASVVVGTKEERIKRQVTPKNGEETARTVEVRAHRIPLYPIWLALAAALTVGLVTGSVFDGLMTLFTWGILGYIAAHCILRRFPFGFSMQIGLISASAVTALAGVIHVFKVSPDFSFELKYCFDLAQGAIQNKLAGILQSAVDLLNAQGMDTTGTVFALSPQTVAEELTYSLMLSLPSLFAIAMLAILCITWWASKELLKRDPKIEIKHMGRLDGYIPGRGVTIFYFAAYVLYMLSGDSIAVNAIGRNLHAVASYVLIFAGFSLALFIINTRAASKPMRILLSVLTLFFAFDSCGSQLLIFAGMFSSQDLRQMMGGGTLK